jgi:hypothetical protein
MKTNKHAVRATGRRFRFGAANCLLGVLLTLPISLARAEVIHGTLINQPPPTNTIVTPRETTPKIINGYLQIGFDKLSAFQATMQTGSTNGPDSQLKLAVPVPAEIAALNGKKVVLQGFMLPLKQDDSRVTELLLLKNQRLCCFGKIPNINEWMHVRMPSGQGVPFGRVDCLVTAWGTLHVGEINFKGEMGGIYSMDGDKMSLEPAFNTTSSS